MFSTLILLLKNKQKFPVAPTIFKNMSWLGFFFSKRKRKMLILFCFCYREFLWVFLYDWEGSHEKTNSRLTTEQWQKFDKWVFIWRRRKGYHNMPHNPSNEKRNAPKSHIDKLLVHIGAEQDLKKKKTPEKWFRSSYLNQFYFIWFWFY